MKREGNSFNNKISSDNAPRHFKFILLFLLLTTFLLSISLISAAQVNFTKDSDSFDKGETLVAKISANFVENPTRDNVFFYRIGNPSNIPFVYDISKIDGIFYVYALIAEKPAGNYSLSLENVKYMSGALENDENIVRNFTITENTSDFSVSPGFINTLTDFSLEVQNLNQNPITITVSASENLSVQSSISLESGEIKEIDFFRSGNGFASESVKLKSPNTEYLIPVFVNSNTTSDITIDSQNNDSVASSSEESLKFEPNRFSISMATNSTLKRIIYILNTGDTDLKNLTFFIPLSLKPYVKIDASSKIDENSSEQVEITLTSDGKEKFVEDDIIARAGNGNLSSSFEISLNFISDYTFSPENGNESEKEPLVLTTCAQLNGNVCSSNETCSGKSEKLSEGVCCIGICEVIKKSSTGKIIGWTLVVLVVLFLLWFFKRYKSVRPSVDLLKIGAKK